MSRPTVVFLGDSLTAGLGLAIDEAYPALIQRRMQSQGFNLDVVNAGVSGDTSAGGLSRVDYVLDEWVRVLVVALGGNDGLRGVPVGVMRRNLQGIVEAAQRQGVLVLLVGMEAPPDYGREYTDAFRQVFRDVADEFDVPLVPFLLAGVAAVPELNQPDGIHPTAEGARILADTVWPALESLLASAPAS